jgi:hypothetical protein
MNQWQIIACVQHGITAPLVAPFKPKDADLYAIVSGLMPRTQRMRLPDRYGTLLVSALAATGAGASGRCCGVER